MNLTEEHMYMYTKNKIPSYQEIVNINALESKSKEINPKVIIITAYLDVSTPAAK